MIQDNLQEASPIRTFQVPATPEFSFRKIQPANIASCSQLNSGEVFTLKDGERWETGCLSYRDAEGVCFDFVHFRHSILETRGDAPYATPQHLREKAFIKLHVPQSDVHGCFPEVIGNRKFAGTEISIRNVWDAELGRYEPMHYSVFSPSYVEADCYKVVGKSMINANLKDEVQSAFDQKKDLRVAVVGRPKVSTHEASQKLHANFNLRSIEILGTAPKAWPRQGVDSASQIQQLTEMLAGTVIQAQ